MKLSRIFGVDCFGTLCLQMLFAAAQPANAPKIVLLKSGASLLSGSTLSCGSRIDVNALLEEIPRLAGITHVLMTDTPATDEHLKALARLPGLFVMVQLNAGFARNPWVMKTGIQLPRMIVTSSHSESGCHEHIMLVCREVCQSDFLESFLF